MATHPFAASVARVSVASAPVSENATAKTIGRLQPLREDVVEYLKNFLIPTEFPGIADNAPENFRVSIGELIAAIDLATLGLDKVDNTPDAEKPISRLMTEALRGKYSSENKPGIADVDGLQELLSKFYSTEVEIPLEAIEGLAQQLTNKADKNHSHSREEFPWMTQLLQGYAAANHSHDLSSMGGWSMFVQSLNEALATFLTEVQVDARVNTLALTIGVDEWE